MTSLGALLLASLLAQSPSPGPGPGPAPTSSAAPSTDGPVAVTTRLTPDPSLVGDLLELHVIAAFPRGYSVNLPIGLDLGAIELVESRELEPESSGEGMRREFVLVLQHFAVGEARVPSFPLTYVDPQGEVQTVPVPAVSFTVTEQLINESDPQRVGEDPRVSLEYPNELAERAIYVGLLALIVGAIIGALLYWRATRPRPVVAPPPAPAHEVALAALDDLADRRLQMLTGGDVLDYYVELTDIAKAYLEGRFGLLASDRTTDEIRATLKRDATPIRPLDASEVLALLDECDLIKFARMTPEPEEAEQHLEEVRGMVQRSKPLPVRVSEGGVEAGPPGPNPPPPPGPNPQPPRPDSPPPEVAA